MTMKNMASNILTSQRKSMTTISLISKAPKQLKKWAVLKSMTIGHGSSLSKVVTWMISNYMKYELIYYWKMQSPKNHKRKIKIGAHISI